MSNESLAIWAEDLARAFREAGTDVTERSLFDRQAFLVDDRLVGMIDLRGGVLKARLNVGGTDRAKVIARPTHDPNGTMPTLLIVTEDDLDFARALVPSAYRYAQAARPPEPAASAPASDPAPTARRRQRATK